MKNSSPPSALLSSALAVLALVAGCEKTTTTTDTRTGTTTTTTTTIAPASQVVAGASQMAASASEMAKKAGDAVVDAAITAKVKTALLADPDVKALRIDVDTRDGVVTLNGTAPNESNADRAAAIAKGIDGVKSVENRLTVKAS